MNGAGWLVAATVRFGAGLRAAGFLVATTGFFAAAVRAAEDVVGFLRAAAGLALVVFLVEVGFLVVAMMFPLLTYE